MDGSLRLRPALALAVAVALGATSAGSAVSAQTPTWVRLGGPQGGVVVALAASVHGGRVLYAATNAGVFRTRNGGASWAPAVRGLPEETPSSLAVDANRPQVLYAAGFDGAYRSSNGGASWKPCTRGLANVEFGDLGAPVVADPRVSGIVYLLADTGLYRSTDSGVSWRRADRGLPGDLGVPAVDPRRSNVLYVFAGSRGGRLYRSSDRGAHWKAVGGRLPAQDFLATVLVDPVAESTLYAAGRGVYTSVDGGRS
jgi:photosystem II stability/assembly factor-like uncharacterized protein